MKKAMLRELIKKNLEDNNPEVKEKIIKEVEKASKKRGKK